MKMKNIPYGEKKSQLLDIYLPDESDSFKTMLFFHGGALEGGSKEDNQDAFNVLIKMGLLLFQRITACIRRQSILSLSRTLL